MKWGLWSTTAGSNSATPPDGWPEGQLPSTVNDCAREMMASIRTGMNDLAQGFIDLGMSPTFVSTTKFTTPSNDLNYLPVGTRFRASDATTLYGIVISASFSTNSAFTVTLDSGNLSTSLSSIAVGVIKSDSINANIPSPFKVNGFLAISSTNALPISFRTNQTFCGLTMQCSAGLKQVRVSNSSVFEIVNSSNTLVISSLTDAGALTCASDITAFSDERLKSGWQDLPRDFVERLANIRRSGTFEKDGSRHVGVGAQSLLDIMPEAVMKNADGYLSVAYGNAALASCVALSQRILELEHRLRMLEQ